MKQTCRTCNISGILNLKETENNERAMVVVLDSIAIEENWPGILKGNVRWTATGEDFPPLTLIEVVIEDIGCLKQCTNAERP